MKIYYWIGLFSFLLTACQQKENILNGESQYRPYAPDGIPFIVADSAWIADMQGNHRAVISIEENLNASAIEVELPWRRADLRPETKKILVVDAITGESIKNVLVCSLSSEKGEIVFQPTTSSRYYIYYLPYKFRRKWDDARYGKPWNDYLPPVYEVDSSWVASLSKPLPKARVERFESRTKFDFFTPMGSIATAKETDSLQRTQKETPILFMEDRAFPIRLDSQLPVRWIQTGPSTHFEGNAMKNEYYAWQIGVWAVKKGLHNVKLQFSDLKHTSGKGIISKDSITCFNQEGINWDGTPVYFSVNVQENKIQALWCGIQIPQDAKPGKYTGEILLSADEIDTPRRMNFDLHVHDQILADKGDSDLWRHARLRWLNSRIGENWENVTPYQPIEVLDNKIQATGKIVTLSENGLPSSIQINGQEILSQPLSFIIETSKGTYSLTASNLKLEKKASGLASWTSSSVHEQMQLTCSATMEYDGYLRYHISVSTDDKIKIKNIKLVTEYKPETSEYFMGAGYNGGKCPIQYRWDWDGPYDSYWMGGVKAGLHVEFRGGSYHGPLLNDYKPVPPLNWANEGKGHLLVNYGNRGNKSVEMNTGSMQIEGKRDFEFALLITPVRPIDTKKHFSMRYYHADPKGFDKAAEDGANIANIHHAQSLNPVINYPFIVQDSLKAFIKHEHELGRKVKIYYTIRELTSYVSEIYALKSLNHEIFSSGVGYGIPWLCEHLIDDYKPAWYTELPGETSDAALVLSGFSRWINYYLEGLRWMFENYDLDGIYMDDVSFDRNVMKRMRKIMEEYHPGALIDLHSNTAYSRGPMNQYTDFFPYIDRIWFGESFRYNEMKPDEWFVTFSGIPFGQMSEMLQDGGNRFLGMVYGTTARYSPETDEKSPVPIWKLWKSFGIDNAKMLGYWDIECPVKTSIDLVKATVYLKQDSMLIAIGNFDTKDQSVKLSVDWNKLGWKSKDFKCTTPEILNYQKDQTVDINSSFSIKAKEGLILLIHK